MHSTQPLQRQVAAPDLTSDILDMLQSAYALVAIYDEDGLLRYANAAYRQAYFIAPDESLLWPDLIRRNHAAKRGSVIDNDDVEAWIASVRSRRGKTRLRTYEGEFHGGRFIWVTETMRDDGWIIFIGTDVTNLHTSERSLRLEHDRLFRECFTDDLTDISNRRHIMARLDEVLAEGQPAWVCLLDIDHFKGINDSYGHHTGDEVLVTLSQTVRNTIKLRDAFGRIGGEEFMIICVNQTLDDVTGTFHLLENALAQMVPISAKPDIRITLSGGLTAIKPGDTPQHILRRADRALYCAKKNGRNQIRLIGSEDDATPSKLL